MNQVVAPGPLVAVPGAEGTNAEWTASLAGLARRHKLWATAQARCALAGFRADLIDGDDGSPMLVVSRWALCRAFGTPGEVEVWLARVAPHLGATS